MNEEEIKLRAKFYLAPKNTTLEELKKMDKKYISYPGLTLDQSKSISKNLLAFKNSLDKDNIRVIKAY
jgi:hypothetical protein